MKEGKEKLAMAKAEEKVNTGREEQSRLLQPSQPSTSTPRKTKDENSVVVPKSQKSFPLTPQSHLQTSTLVNSIKLNAGKDGGRFTVSVRRESRRQHFANSGSSGEEGLHTSHLYES